MSKQEDQAGSGGLDTLYIVFDGPPGKESGRFLEVENQAGESVGVANWIEGADGLWYLGPFRAAVPKRASIFERLWQAYPLRRRRGPEPAPVSDPGVIHEAAPVSESAWNDDTISYDDVAGWSEEVSDTPRNHDDTTPERDRALASAIMTHLHTRDMPATKPSPTDGRARLEKLPKYMRSEARGHSGEGNFLLCNRLVHWAERFEKALGELSQPEADLKSRLEKAEKDAAQREAHAVYWKYWCERYAAAAERFRAGLSKARDTLKVAATGALDRRALLSDAYDADEALAWPAPPSGPEPCPTCKGTGWMPTVAPGHSRPCNVCGTTGKLAEPATDTSEAIQALDAIDTPFRRTSESYAAKMDTIRRHLSQPAPAVPDAVRRLPDHFRTVATFSHQTEESAHAWEQAAKQLDDALADSALGAVDRVRGIVQRMRADAQRKREREYITDAVRARAMTVVHSVEAWANHIEHAIGHNEQGAQEGLSFDALRTANVHRCEASFHPLDHWNPMEWGAACAGEVGEGINAAKKLRRMQDSEQYKKTFQRTDATLQDVADEIADSVIYADLWAASIGIDLGAAIISKFDRTSDKVRSDVKLAAAPKPQGQAKP